MGMFVTDGIKRNSSYLSEQINPYNPVAMDQYRTIRGTLGSQTFQRDLVPEMALKGKVVTQAMVKQIVGSRASLPVCIHVEYPKLEPTPYAQRATTVELFRRDAAVARGWLGLT